MKKTPQVQRNASDVLNEKREALADVQRKAAVLTRIVDAAKRRAGSSADELEYLQGLHQVNRSTSEQVHRAMQDHAQLTETLSRESRELEATQQKLAELKEDVQRFEWGLVTAEAQRFKDEFHEAATKTVEAFERASLEQERMVEILRRAHHRFPESVRFGSEAISDHGGLPPGIFLWEFLPPTPGNENRLGYLKRLLANYDPTLLRVDDPIRVAAERRRVDDLYEQELVAREQAARRKNEQPVAAQEAEEVTFS